MLKAIYAVAAAATIASWFTGAVSISGEVEARASGSGKDDRAEIRALARDCSQQEWPYYEAIYLHDKRNTLAKARSVRFVSTDRATQ